MVIGIRSEFYSGMVYDKSMSGYLGQCHLLVNCDFIHICGTFSNKIGGTRLRWRFRELIDSSIVLLTLGIGPAFCSYFTGPKSSKRVVSREEAIAIIDEQYRCVFPFCFSMHISSREYRVGLHG